MSKYRLTEEQVTKVIVNAVKALHEEVNKQRLAESTDKKALNEVLAKRNQEFIEKVEAEMDKNGFYLDPKEGHKYWYGMPENEEHPKYKRYGWISYRNINNKTGLEPVFCVIGEKTDEMAGNGRPTVVTFADALYNLKRAWRDKLIKQNRENGTSVRALRGQKEAPVSTSQKIDIHAVYNQFKDEAHRLGIAMDVNSDGLLELDGDEAKCMQMVQFAKEQGFPNGAIVNGKEVK